MNKTKLKQLIKEEIQAILESDYDPHQPSGLGSARTLTAIEAAANSAYAIEYQAGRVLRSHGDLQWTEVEQALLSIKDSARRILTYANEEQP
tara:strand:- start:810 stop:1085 length:276 start_codon:yes stop_codon:yes gene_type:complete